jgi:hypothetical protein
MCELDSAGSGQSPVFRVYSNEFLGSMRDREFLDQLHDFKLL